MKELMVLVWDGEKMNTVTRGEAKALEEDGTHQIATGRQSRELWSKEEFAMRLKDKPKRRGRPKKRTYETREMRADNPA